MIKISFWAKDTGNLLMHSSGLTPEQVLALKDLKVGDRLVLWLNADRKDERHPTYTMKTFQPREKTEDKPNANAL